MMLMRVLSLHHFQTDFPKIRDKMLTLALDISQILGFHGDSDGKKKIYLWYRKPRFNPWVGKISWKRAWQPIPVFLPGEFHGQRSLVSYSPWSHKELNSFFVSLLRIPDFPPASLVSECPRVRP